MASDDSSGSRPATPIVLRIKLRYDDVEAMVQRFAANVGKSGLFLPTRSLQPIDAEIKFELRLADDTPVLVGLGRVKEARPPDPQHPRAAFGMAVELMRVTPQSRALILRMLERRRETGLPEIGLPTASDIDAARRAEAAEGGGREIASGPVPVVAAVTPPPAQAVIAPAVLAPPATAPPVIARPAIAQAVIAPAVIAPPVVARPVIASPAIASPVIAPAVIAPPAIAPAVLAPAVIAPPAIAPPIAPVETPLGEALLTAPRRASGPIPVAKTVAVAALTPEPPRKRRLAVSEVIESASGPVARVSAAVPGLDEEVDVAATLARARALAGGTLDAELEALSEVAAAPLEISVDAASAELARQLGGSAVRRDRAAGWAPPPAMIAATPAGGVEVTPPEPAVAEAAPESASSVPVAGAAPERAAAGAAPERAASERAAAEAAPERAAAEAALERAAAERATAEVAAEPAAPEPVTAEPALAPVTAEIAAEPAAPDAVMAEAVPELLAPEPLAPEPVEALRDLPVDPAAGAAADPGLGPDRVGPSRTEPSEPRAFAPSAAAAVAAALADLDADERTELGNVPVANSDFDAPGDDDVDAEFDAAGRDPGAGGPPIELGVDELDDFEILEEADADDEDLLAAHGEADASNRHALQVEPAAGRPPSEIDFAARLDLGDESDLYFGAPSDEFSAHHVVDSLNDELTGQHVSARPHAGYADAPADADPHFDSAGAALAMFDGDDGFEGDAEVTDDPDVHRLRRAVQPIFEPEPSSSFTAAGIPSDSIDLDAPTGYRSDRPARRQPALGSEPAIVRSAPRPLYDGPVEDHELEHALAALDVDLDDLSIPHATPQPQREPSRPTAANRSGPVTYRSAPQPRAPVPTPAPQPRAPVVTPSRAVRHTGPGGHVPGSGRAVAPRVPSEGVDVDFDDDD